MNSNICLFACMAAFMIGPLRASAEQSATTSQHPDTAEVNALIAQVSRAYVKLQTMTLEVSEHFEKRTGDQMETKEYTHRYQMKRPDEIHIERYIQNGAPEAVVMSDGRTVWVYDVKKTQYLVRPADSASGKIEAQPPFASLFLHPRGDENMLIAQKQNVEKLAPLIHRTNPAATIASSLDKKRVDGTECDVLEFIVAAPNSPKVVNRYYFGPDRFLRRLEEENWTGNGKLDNRTQIDLVHQQINSPIANAVFTFAPPPGSRKVDKL